MASVDLVWNFETKMDFETTTTTGGCCLGRTGPSGLSPPGGAVSRGGGSGLPVSERPVPCSGGPGLPRPDCALMSRPGAPPRLPPLPALPAAAAEDDDGVWVISPVTNCRYPAHSFTVPGKHIPCFLNTRRLVWVGESF